MSVSIFRHAKPIHSEDLLSSDQWDRVRERVSASYKRMMWDAGLVRPVSPVRYPPSAIRYCFYSSDRTPTATSNLKGRVYINLEWWETLDPKRKILVLCHEMEHVLFAQLHAWSEHQAIPGNEVPAVLNLYDPYCAGDRQSWIHVHAHIPASIPPIRTWGGEE